MVEMTKDELASLASFTVAFYKHNSELWSLFKKAQSGSWDGARLLAATRNTKWFKTHNEAQRQSAVLKTSDPAEYDRRVTEMREKVRAITRQTGLGISTDKDRTAHILTRITNMAFNNQWSDQQIKQALATYKTVQTRVAHSRFETTGLAAEGERLARRLSRDYGIGASGELLGNLARDFALGKRTAENIQAYFIQKAKSTYAGVAQEIDSGLTVRQIAEPYIDSMARLWEINPNDIDVRDSNIRKALTSRAEDGNPMPRAIWQFEDDLRKSSRWKATNNARESLLGAGHAALRDMGLVT